MESMDIMKTSFFEIGQIPAVIYGGSAEKVYLFVHGKCGCKEEGADFARVVCPKGWQVLAVDLPDHGCRKGVGEFVPWQAVPELRAVINWAKERWPHIALRANSLGAWFSMLAFETNPPEKALFVSPVVDMNKLIEQMMGWAVVDEARLRAEREIKTDFGETLSWRYLQYARENPIERWACPTAVLYAGKDHLVKRKTIETFIRRFGCRLTVMEEGEHWFHTPEQLAVLEEWTAQEG